MIIRLLIVSILLVTSQGWKFHVRRALGSGIISFIFLGYMDSPGFRVDSAGAVSGGGKDFANKDLRDGDLEIEGKSFVGKDFTQVLANDVSFKGANLQGCRFYKANLNKADFTNSDLGTASLEDAGLEGTIFDNAVLAGAYISSSFEMAGSIKNVDFSDALIPKKTNAILCERDDIGGTNPKTGVSTSESLLCE